MKPLDILVVEDELAIAHALSYTVKKFFDCRRVDIAGNGAEGWAKVLANSYDLIISDWNMPRKTGDELLADVRSLERTKEVPFLMLTARADRVSVATAIKSGANSYLVKPFERESLVVKIEQLLHIGRLGQKPGGEQGTEEVSNAMDVIDQIAKKLKSGDIDFPVLPDVAFKITETLNDSTQDVEQIVETLKLDPGITPKLIGLANSALYKGSKRIMNIEDAAVRIGLKQVKSVAILAINKGLYNTENRKFEAMLSKLWTHAVAVACCSKRIATSLSLSEPEVIFTMGLLHDVGKLVLIKLIIDHYPELEDDAIDEILKSLHSQAGAAVLKEWKLPLPVVEAALLHHDVREGDKFSFPLKVVAFANVFVRSLGFSFHEIGDTNIEALASEYLIDLSAEQLSEITEQVNLEIKHINSSL